MLEGKPLPKLTGILLFRCSRLCCRKCWRGYQLSFILFSGFYLCFIAQLFLFVTVPLLYLSCSADVPTPNEWATVSCSFSMNTSLLSIHVDGVLNNNVSGVYFMMFTTLYASCALFFLLNDVLIALGTLATARGTVSTPSAFRRCGTQVEKLRARCSCQPSKIVNSRYEE